MFHVTTTVVHQDDSRIEKTSGDSVVCTAGMESLAMLHDEKKCGWTLADMLSARCHYLRMSICVMFTLPGTCCTRWPAGRSNRVACVGSSQCGTCF